MAAPGAVLELVDRFARNHETYRTDKFKEAELRVEYLNPFFEALGWDVRNTQGAADAYKDVIHEDAIKIGAATKAPDYCFRIGGKRIFFVEAKQPSGNLKEAAEDAFQLRRYAFSSKLPLSILTDFEEFAVYDGRVRPHKDDKASAARVRYMTYAEYKDNWEDIASVFSRDAVLKGSFDKYAETSKGKKGTATVDDAFLEEIESWRDSLAHNLALRNPKLTQRELNFAVQRTIDRIVFLRICEDRGIEQYGSLLALTNGDDVYARLRKLFRDADDRYNSGLFHFQKEKERHEPPDELTLRLEIDDKPLKDIVKSAYYPESPYEFSVLPADILGQVYEQFLGKVIERKPGHRATVTEKEEVKKAGGVYYTPTYIVDYIVKHTVGKLLEGKTPKQAAKLRILDPACGSGSFLIAAYQYLLDWYRDRYVADGAETHTKELYQGKGGAWKLATAERKRILLNNVYGVDIDSQAVEVTKLSLLLKVLEGENQETLARQLRIFHERALPDLGDNVKCGNSLIGQDFYNNVQKDLFGDDEARHRINAFEWEAEFPEIMRAGGFDTVIGNPPWGQKGIVTEEAAKEYIRKTFPFSSGIFDMFRPFIERAASLLKAGGYFGMVLPDIVLLKDYESTRLFIMDHLTLQAIDWWGMAFKSAVIDACTIIGKKGPSTAHQAILINVRDPKSPLSHSIRQEEFRRNPRCTFNLMLTEEKRRILERLDLCPGVGDYFEIHEGVHSGNIRAELFVSRAIDKSCREMYFGRDEISRYSLHWNGLFIRASAAPSRRTASKYANLGQPEWYDREKLLVRRTGDFVLAAVDRHRRYASNNFFIVFPKASSSLELDGMCALLNSRFITWYFRTIEPRKGRVFAELKIKHLSVFPLPPQVTQDDGCRELNELGARRTALAYEEIRAGVAGDSSEIKRVQEHIDSQIDAVVCRLFGVSEESVMVPLSMVDAGPPSREVTNA